MNKYVMHISYLGTNYSGWQIQNNAQTIQEANSTSEIEMNNKDEYTPQLFLHDNESEVESELEETGRDEHTEKLFDQDLNEEEDFEIPAFLRKQKF